MSSFKKGDLVQFESKEGQKGFGVVLNPEEAFTIVGEGGRTGYSMAKLLLNHMEELSPLRDREVNSLAFEVRFALQAVVTSIH